MKVIQVFIVHVKEEKNSSLILLLNCHEYFVAKLLKNAHYYFFKVN